MSTSPGPRGAPPGASSAPPGPSPGLRARPRYSPAQLARLLGGTEPTAEQAAVIGAPLGPMAVIAGAGSGKSETMAARLVWLVANQLVRPERVLGLTFTRKAAAELGERVRARLDRLQRAGLAGGAGGEELPGEPTVSTYHAYAGRLVADHALRDGLEPSLRLITPAVSWQIAASVVAAYAGPMDAISWAPATVTAAVIDLAGELAEHLRQAGDVLGAGRWLDEQAAGLAGRVPALARKVIRCQRTREQLLPLVAAYHAAKTAREVIDYGDQMAIAARIASRHLEVGAGERGRYPVVLLDEYQDTSHAQLVLLRSLFGGGHPVTAVGDPCQSIYGWRGASAGNLRRFRTDFPAGRAPAPVLMLSTSFRNTGAVLAAAGAIQAELRAAAPEVPLLAAPPGRAERGQVVSALLESAAAEADWVAGQAAGLLAGQPGRAPDGGPWPDGRQDAVRPSDIAVLCRKRSQFPALRAALEARGIPVEVVGLGGLLTVPEVADIVATLRVLHDPTASDALARLLTSPRWRIGPADLVALGRRARALASMAASPGPPAADRAGTAAGAGAAPGSAPASGSPGSAARRPVAGRGERGPAESGPGQLRAGELMTQAVTDLTRDTGSLVEALDDLDGPQAYSAAGYARLSALAAELRLLRTHVARPLPDLVGEVERTLGLDIEVAARPGADPASARADLDAFTDAAAAFAGDREEHTLGAFLAYLTAAESEEFGLEGGRVGETDSVKLATVHASKGLQWAAVFVPGLSDGKKSHVFPASPRVTTRWTENPRLLPFWLRGDAIDLPALDGLAASQLASFGDACSARELGEERRLAYVAATRAAFWLACSGYWWGEGASRLGPSAFLTEVRGVCEAGEGVVAAWEPEPDEDAENPALTEPSTALWPAEAAADARASAIRAAAKLVTSAMADLERQSRRAPARPLARPAAVAAVRGGASAAAEPDGTGGADRDGMCAADPDGTGAADPDGHQELIDSWASEAELLLAERARRRAGGQPQVALPRQLPVSALVAMARDPGELAAQVRRPMPRPPAPHALRGTEFHRWLEERFGQPQLIDADELPGAADDPGGAEPDAELAELKAKFTASEWADRQPAEVEVPFETLIADRLVRGRIDAVFADAADGRYDVVDWKTGRPPGRRGRPACCCAPARRLPAGLGRAGRGAGQLGAGRVLLRALRPDGPPGRPAR